jgi:hypothetical protein
MSWENNLPIKKKKDSSDAWMVRPKKELKEWLNKQVEKHPGVSGNQIIIAILEDAMKRDAND